MTQMKNRLVLVAGTKPTVSHHLTELLGEWGYEPVAADSVDGALAEMEEKVLRDIQSAVILRKLADGQWQPRFSGIQQEAKKILGEK